jgi:hypothetical protein
MLNLFSKNKSTRGDDVRVGRCDDDGNLLISEISIRALSGGQSDKVSLSTVSAQTTKQTIIDAEKVAVFCEFNVFFREGSDPTALSDGTDQIIPGGVWTRITKTPGYKLAFILATGIGAVYITPGA